MSRTNTHPVMLILLAALALVLAAGGVAPRAQSKAELAFKAAMDKEVVDGDLEAAIALYRQIAKGSDRAVAARALVRMGQCYEKLGSQEAQRAYEQVLKDYADQPEAAGFARGRLAALRRAAAEPTEPTIQARRLLAGHYPSEVEMSGGPTPDGRSLVYIDPTLENLAIRDLQTGASRLITNRGSENGYVAQSAIVSPDGRRVAYAWQWHASPQHPTATMELRIVGTDGSGDRLLREEQRIWPHSWSSDGRYIAARILEPTDDSNTQTALISLQDGSKRILGTLPTAGRLSFSPDDRFVAVQFRVDDQSSPDISLLSTKGGTSLPLVAHPADDRLVGWIPGTNEVLFTSDRSGNRDLWAVGVGEDGRASLPRPVRRGVGEMAPMGFTRDGSLFYSVYTLQYNIFIAPFEEASGRVNLSEATPLGGRGSNMRPAWSPNGEYLAFARRSPAPPGRAVWAGGTREIVGVLNTKTRQERVMVEDIAPATVPPPTWFPDGRSLLVLGIPQSAAARSADRVASGVYRVDLATGAATTLFEFPPDRNWWFGKGLVASPDGDGVIYVHDGRMVLRRLQSGKEEELYRDAALGAGLVFTPDKSELAFAIGASATPAARRLPKKLMVMPARGGEARELITIPESAQAGIVGWTSDGRYLLLLVRDETGQTIARVPRAGGKLERLSPIQKEIRDLSPSPDGRRVAYWIQENEAEIWVLENIKEVLARGR